MIPDDRADGPTVDHDRLEELDDIPFDGQQAYDGWWLLGCLVGWPCGLGSLPCNSLLIESGSLALSVAVAFDDEFEGCGLQPVECGLAEQLVGHHGQDFRAFPV